MRIKIVFGEKLSTVVDSESINVCLPYGSVGVLNVPSLNLTMDLVDIIGIEGNKPARYNGVFWNVKSRKWSSNVLISGKVVNLGLYDTEGRAYDMMQFAEQHRELYNGNSIKFQKLLFSIYEVKD